ncbi:MAG: hypothetical protein NC038_04095 [Paludibacter sp.]|nr:hypothetical protein [Bacteroidales bacterium]MCM1069403.1 hypothetical protein [Prevotella sp.]MCM1353778.1 hypothetical protein [Bacteroides sp.]MCM1442821.1 hypothetical protein [Muribaculum sp.]MCM1481813.1 hypothetical protein [Paludibacter sp.]
MKKSILMAALMAVLCISSAVAQPRAVGVNLGSGLGLSYQHGFGETNMLDVAVNIPFFNGIGGIVTYDWINPFNTAVPWEYKGEWNWYMGVGAAAGIYGFSAPTWYAGVAGHFGIEYDFWFPLQLSLDWRPNIGVYGDKDHVGFNPVGLYDGIALGVRYKF